MTFFSTPERIEIGDIPFIASHEKPTRKDGLLYYRRVAEHYELDIRPGQEVLEVTRDDGGFVAQVRRPHDETTYRARGVVFATGYFDNPNYGYGDGITLYSMIRHLKPRRIIEVGSGFSSAAMLDVNELFFNNSIACTFVEPRPQLLQSLMKEGDRSRIRLLPYTVQDVDPQVFRELEASDILFIDSSHVSKTGSDVNSILFKILPILNAGVHVHFHDIFYPFEYPPHWVYENRAWNEAYLLRAFLQYNRTFEVEFFSTYMVHKHLQVFESRMPHFLKNRGGNIWLTKAQLDSKLDRIDEKIERTKKPVPRSLAPALAERCSRSRPRTLYGVECCWWATWRAFSSIRRRQASAASVNGVAGPG